MRKVQGEWSNKGVWPHKLQCQERACWSSDGQCPRFYAVDTGEQDLKSVFSCVIHCGDSVEEIVALRLMEED